MANETREALRQGLARREARRIAQQIRHTKYTNRMARWMDAAEGPLSRVQRRDARGGKNPDTILKRRVLTEAERAQRSISLRDAFSRRAERLRRARNTTQTEIALSSGAIIVRGVPDEVNVRLPGCAELIDCLEAAANIEWQAMSCEKCPIFKRRHDLVAALELDEIAGSRRPG